MRRTYRARLESESLADVSASYTLQNDRELLRVRYVEREIVVFLRLYLYQRQEYITIITIVTLFDLNLQDSNCIMSNLVPHVKVVALTWWARRHEFSDRRSSHLILISQLWSEISDVLLEILQNNVVKTIRKSIAKMMVITIAISMMRGIKGREKFSESDFL